MAAAVQDCGRRRASDIRFSFPRRHARSSEPASQNDGSQFGAARAEYGCLCPTRYVRELIRSFPRLGDILWRDTLIDAAIFRQWMLGMGRKDAPQRIANLFCELFTKLQAVG